MANKKWAEIEQGTKYKNASDRVKGIVKKKFFDARISVSDSFKNATESVQSKVREKFLGLAEEASELSAPEKSPELLSAEQNVMAGSAFANLAAEESIPDSPSEADLLIDPSTRAQPFRAITEGESVLSETTGQVGAAVEGGIEDFQNMLMQQREETGVNYGQLEAFPGLSVDALAEGMKMALPKSKFEARSMLFGGEVGAGLFRTGGKFVRATQDVINPAVAPHIAKIAATARARGIPLSLAELSDSKASASLESLLEKHFMSADVIKGFRDDQIKALSAFAGKISAKLGGPEGNLAAGNAFQSAMKDFSQQWRARANRLYDIAGELMNPQAQLDATPLVDAAKNIVRSETAKSHGLRNTKLIGVARGIIEKAVKEVPVPPVKGPNAKFMAGVAQKPLPKTKKISSLTYDEVVQERSGLIQASLDRQSELAGKGLAFQSDQTTRQLAFLMDSIEGKAGIMEKAIAGNVISKNGKNALQAARAFWKGGKAKFSEKAIRKVILSNPEDVVKLVFRPGNETEIKIIKQAVGQDAFDNLRQTFVQNALSDPKAGMNFTPEGLLRALRPFQKPGDNTLEAIFSSGRGLPGAGSALDEINDLINISKQVGASQRKFKTSGTAENLVSFMTGGMILNDVVVGSSIAIGARYMAKLYVSAPGRALIKRALIAKPGTVEGAKVFTALTGFFSGKVVRHMTKPKKEGDDANKKTK